MKQDALITLYLTCNYNCSYCWQHTTGNLSSKMGKAATTAGMMKIVDFFNARGEWHIGLTGGEATIHPQFIQFAEEITKKHFLRVFTNNSISYDKLSEFISKVNLKRVDYFHCSFQEQDEEPERLKHFLNKIKIMKENGIRVRVSYVSTPQRIKNISKYSELFRSNNIPFLVQPFNGVIGAQRYPESYSIEENEILDNHIVAIEYKSMLDRYHNKFTGKICNAGYKKIYVNGVTGNVYKCANNQSEIIGNVYTNILTLTEGAEPCKVKRCGCDYPVDIEPMIIQDNENIFRNNPKTYDRELFEHYKDRLDQNELQYSMYWNEEKKQRIEKIFGGEIVKNVGIYGTGTHTDELLKAYEAVREDQDIIFFFFDSNPNKWGKEYYGKIIYSPERVKEMNLDRIIISSYSYQEEIYESLKKVTPEKLPIIRIYEKSENVIFI